ncbi:S1 family peptidase [Flavivirga jejuensis]|uniref:Serine protease n=1 Tax=Flavivirga jejuensis TaxID=870487 RepID=A0ABT8WK39_9FLAO|nr:serine protease [Flavivirga jejuensis]MDO5973519.1 serine protease [Flavivirga jejuensis]
MNHINVSHFIFPLAIVNFDSKKGEGSYKRFLGTGFLIGNEGFFLSAKHVLNENIFNELNENEYVVGLFHSHNPNAFKVLEVEDYSNSKTDLMIGKMPDIPQIEDNIFKINKYSKAHGWVDVHSYGFPNSLVDVIPEKGQFLKGYISRITDENENIGTFEEAPSSYLLSSPIPSGMSGSPLFVRNNGFVLAGICLGTVESTTTLWENNFIEDDGTKIKEQKDRVLENGIALIIANYLEWEISIANDRLLKDLF